MKNLHNRKLIIWDFDGTLADTSLLIVGSYEHALGLAEINLNPRAAWHATEGMTLARAYEYLAPSHDQKQLMAAHREFQDHNTDLVKAYPDVPYTLETLSSFGKQHAVLTNRTGNAEDLLKQCGIHRHFAWVITATTAPKPKPAPDGIFALLRHFGARPDQAVIVGDTQHDIAAGKAAGVATVVVARNNNRVELESHSPDWVVDSLLELTQ